VRGPLTSPSFLAPATLAVAVGALLLQAGQPAEASIAGGLFTLGAGYLAVMVVASLVIAVRRNAVSSVRAQQISGAASPGPVALMAGVAFGAWLRSQGHGLDHSLFAAMRAVCLTFACLRLAEAAYALVARRFGSGSSAREKAGIRLATDTNDRPKHVGVALAAIGLLGLGARLWLAASFHGNFDQDSYELVVAALRSDGDIYGTLRYNYSPLWAHLLLALDTIAVAVGMPFHVLVRGFLSLVDAGNAYLIYRLARQESGAGRWRPVVCFGAYALNPLAILITGYHGQFETLAAFPLLLAVAWRPAAPTQRQEGQRRQLLTVWLLATLALLVKQNTAFLVVALLFTETRSVWRAGALAAASGAIFLLSLLPYWLAQPEVVNRMVLLYTGVPRPYGLTWFLDRGPALAVLMVGMGIVIWLTTRVARWSPAACLRAVAVAFVVLTPHIAEQQLFLPLVFGTPFIGLGLGLYSVVGTGLLLGSPHYPQVLPPVVLWETVWLAALAWAISLPGRRRVTTSPSLSR